MYNAASWVQSYQSCRDLLITGITVDSRENKDIEKERYATVKGRNTDGLDLTDCENVRVSDCFINNGDDAICIKSFSPQGLTRNITISNCVVSSNASGIKIGTETAGIIEDITISNCVVYDTRNDALAIMTVDGARIRRINFNNITCRNIKACAIFVRLGERLRPYRKNAKLEAPALEDIIFDNIQGTGISSDHGSIIAGLASKSIKNIRLSNIQLCFDGGGPSRAPKSPLPEQNKKYPNGKMFGPLPAYGLYVRYAEHVELDRVQFTWKKTDPRPAIFCDTVQYLNIQKLRGNASPSAPELIKLHRVKNAEITQSKAIGAVPSFTSALESNNIITEQCQIIK